MAEVIQWTTNRKSYVAHRMLPIAKINDLQ